MEEQMPFQNTKQILKKPQTFNLPYMSDEDVLREREKQYRALVESTEDSIYLVDKNGRYLFINKKHLSRIEQKPEKVMGKSYADFHSSGDAKEFNKNMKDVLRSGISVQQEYRSRIDSRYFLRTLSPVKKSDGSISAVTVISKDITERKRAETALKENKQFLDTIFDSIQDGISVLDPELNIVRVNQAMENWYAHMLPLEGKKCYQAYHKREKACDFCPTLRALESGRLEMNEVPLVQEKGLTGTLELYAFPMLDDSLKPVGVVEYVRDITKRKRAEEALKKSAEKIKMFAYSVAHDLKNPAVAICLLAESLQRKYEAVLDEKGNDYCKHILDATKQLAALVEQINTYISSKESPLTIERVNLNQLFDSVREEFSSQIDARHICWSQPENRIYINVDRISLLRVLRNFVDNTLKYGGEVLSKINLGYQESDKFHIISVEDDGVGLGGGDTRKIFDVFQRAMTSNGIEGTGLGLSIAHEIADRHEGRVWAESGMKKETIFHISISKDLK